MARPPSWRRHRASLIAAKACWRDIADDDIEFEL
jgi:hypothetical protein